MYYKSLILGHQHDSEFIAWSRVVLLLKLLEYRSHVLYCDFQRRLNCLAFVGFWENQSLQAKDVVFQKAPNPSHFGLTMSLMSYAVQMNVKLALLQGLHAMALTWNMMDYVSSLLLCDTHDIHIQEIQAYSVLQVDAILCFSPWFLVAIPTRRSITMIAKRTTWQMTTIQRLLSMKVNLKILMVNYIE